MKIALIRSDGRKAFIDVEATVSAPWFLLVSGEGLRGRKFQGETLFDALTALRRYFEAQGGKVACAGARKDVYPSGMARSMGSARKAYRMELGHSANVLVDIFDPADPEDVGTIEEQASFMEAWVKSLREKLL